MSEQDTARGIKENLTFLFIRSNTYHLGDEALGAIGIGQKVPCSSRTAGQSDTGVQGHVVGLTG